MKPEKITFNRDNLRWWDRGKRVKENLFILLFGIIIGMFAMFMICGVVRWMT